MRNNVRLYREAIVQVLDDLKEEGVVEEYKHGFKRESLVFFLSISGLHKDLHVEFIPRLSGKAKGSANFFQVPLPSIPESISVTDIRDSVKREIRSRKKGSGSEALAAHVLSMMVRDKEFDRFFKTDRRRDIEGIDFMVFFWDLDLGHMDMPLQVKSSEAGQERHKKEHPEIPSARIEVDGSYYTVRQKFLKIRDAFARGEILHI